MGTIKFAECYCPKCGGFIITFETEIPEQKYMICPVCNNYECDLIKSD